MEYTDEEVKQLAKTLRITMPEAKERLRRYDALKAIPVGGEVIYNPPQLPEDQRIRATCIVLQHRETDEVVLEVKVVHFAPLQNEKIKPGAQLNALSMELEI